MEGLTRVMSMLDGSCMSRYPTKKMLVARLKSVPVMPRSFSSVPCLACARFDRSRKFSRYMTIRKGSRCASTLRRSFFVRTCCCRASSLSKCSICAACAVSSELTFVMGGFSSSILADSLTRLFGCCRCVVCARGRGGRGLYLCPPSSYVSYRLGTNFKRRLLLGFGP